MPAIFTNVVKPTHVCNINCKYCFNEDVRKPRMTFDTMRNVVSKTMDFVRLTRPSSQVDFIWHGGEPMAVGLDFYNKVAKVQSQLRGQLLVANTIQTNGTLINESWAEFFKQNRFNVSISIDGPKRLNDATRVDFRFGSTFDRVRASFDVLRRYEVPFGVCVVLSRANSGSVDEILDFLVAERLPFNLIPLTLSGSARSHFEELGLDADDYAAPWIRMFDRWYDLPPEKYIYCSDFVLKARAVLGGAPTDCIGQANCSIHHVSTDPEGYVYPCATLSGDADWKYGNLNDNSMSELLDSSVARSALARQLDPHCVECRWRHVCHGGCMQRAFKFFGTIDTRDFYCPSLYRIYEHIAQKIIEEDHIDLSRLPPPQVKRSPAANRKVVNR